MVHSKFKMQRIRAVEQIKQRRAEAVFTGKIGLIKKGERRTLFQAGIVQGILGVVKGWYI